MQVASPKATASKIAPICLYGHATVRIGNKFFIMGGYKEKDILDDCLANGKIYQVTVIDDCTFFNIFIDFLIFFIEFSNNFTINSNCSLVSTTLLW